MITHSPRGRSLPVDLALLDPIQQCVYCAGVKCCLDDGAGPISKLGTGVQNCFSQ